MRVSFVNGVDLNVPITHEPHSKNNEPKENALLYLKVL